MEGIIEKKDAIKTKILLVFQVSYKNKGKYISSIILFLILKHKNHIIAQKSYYWKIISSNNNKVLR